MKTEIELLIVKDTESNVICDIKAIEDIYTRVLVTYPAGKVSIDEVIEWGRSIWGDRVFHACSEYLSDIEKGHGMQIEAEAKDLPSFEEVVVYTKTITLDTEEFDL